jgi:hypothetical protein
MIYLNLQTGLCLNGGKMYKRLIDEKWESYNSVGNEFRREIGGTMALIFKKYVKKGYSIIDMEKIGMDEISILCGVLRLTRNCNLRKKERENGN